MALFGSTGLEYKPADDNTRKCEHYRSCSATRGWRAWGKAEAFSPPPSKESTLRCVLAQACQDAHSQVVAYSSVSDFFANSFFAFLLVRAHAQPTNRPHPECSSTAVVVFALW